MGRRLAVVSPFIDKKHGTERRVAEEVEHLARDFGYEIHLFSQRVEDVPLGPQGSGGGRILWHRIPALPGPHLTSYLWWFAANHLWRWWHRRRGLKVDLTYSPGINCIDADAVSVHIVFAEFFRKVRPDLRLAANPISAWPRLIHRRLYYRLIMALERRVYGKTGPSVAVVSRKVAEDLARHFRKDPSQHPVVYHGIDLGRFNPDTRRHARQGARRALGLGAEQFALLLVGNGWRNKGLATLLEAMALLDDPQVQVLVVGQDDPSPFEASLTRPGERVRFLPPRHDVEFYYAAADAYVGPSLEDAFALPPAEAMACGLPAIVSSEAGVSEIVTDGFDALILQDPRDASELASLIQRLRIDPEMRQLLGDNAARTGSTYTWDENAAAMHVFFQDTLRGRKRPELDGPVLGLFPELGGVGGVQEAGRQVAEALARWASARGVPYRFLSLNDPPGREAAADSVPFQGFGRNKVGFSLAALRERPGTVVALHPHLAPLALRRAHRAIVFCHGVDVWKPLSAPRRRALQSVAGVAAPSADTAGHVANAQGVAEERVRLLPWALPRRDGTGPLPQDFPERRVILTVTRVASSDGYKGVDTLIEALKEVVRALPEVSLAVVGDGDDRPRLEHMAAEKGLGTKVSFLGQLPPEQLAACYQNSEVFALPSAGEGFGLVFLEAMAVGVPCVAANAGGAPEVVKDEVTGLLVPSGDAEALAEALIRLLSDETLRRSMGEAGRRRVTECFSPERFEKDLHALLDEVAFG